MLALNDQESFAYSASLYPSQGSSYRRTQGTCSASGCFSACFLLDCRKKNRCPFLFVDGVCLGSHDSLLQLYQSGVLAKHIAGELPPTSPYFAGELPIGLY